MASIIKVNEYKDFGNNAIMTSDGSGVITPNADGIKNVPNFSANKTSGSISFSVDTFTKITLDNELYDTNDAYDTTTGRFTVPSGKDGKYSFSAHLALYEESNNNMTGTNMGFYVNGSLAIYLPDRYVAMIGNYKLSIITADINLSAEDYIELWATVYSTGTARAEVGASFNRFSGFKLIE